LKVERLLGGEKMWFQKGGGFTQVPKGVRVLKGGE